MKLEVIAKDLADVITINNSKADRIEFCSNLEVGGLTPSYEDILEATNISKIPVNVMVRPTNRDFYYTDEEFEQMLEDIKFINSTKANGIVIGILNQDQTINLERMKKVMEVKDSNKTITFHRAFEEVKDPIDSLQKLADLGVDHILTSGNGKIMDSLELLKVLTDQKKVKIIGGSGINLNNVKTISDVVDEIHVGTAIRNNSSWNEEIDEQLIEKFVNILHNL